ncbi:hypothetical protein FACS189491_09600 [Spirochaetia bacterium]|nr:hypothetical protein FACS189491_09600 [Spirochaetia bacterium]
MQPYLSVVAVSRNDDHGGDPLRRTQIFIDSLAWQAQKYALSVELILVDWNPPEDKPGLSEALSFPVNEWFSARIVVVPYSLHEGFRHGDRQPLFQMIGKNVGIRRAEGEFILATNIDILLDDSLFECISKKTLDGRYMYRADRYDVLTTIPEENHDVQQAFCRNVQNHVRRNHRGSDYYCHLQERKPFDSKPLLSKTHEFPWAEFSGGDFPSVMLKPGAPLNLLNTNACGDFTLMHRDAWAVIRGYGEFEAYSFNIDSIGCTQAYLAGYNELGFLPPLVCYHIEHAPASGFTPETEDLLFARIRKNSLPIMEWEVINNVLIKKMEADPKMRLNSERWGLRDFILEESVCTETGTYHVTAEFPAHYFKTLSALHHRMELEVSYQDYFLLEIKQIVLAKCLIKHRVWKILLLGLPCFKALRKIYRFIKYTLLRRKRNGF